MGVGWFGYYGIGIAESADLLTTKKNKKVVVMENADNEHLKITFFDVVILLSCNVGNQTSKWIKQCIKHFIKHHKKGKNVCYISSID